MARTAVIDGGTVENVIEAEPGFTIPGKLLVVSAKAGPGWSYANGAFSPPVGGARETIPKLTVQKRLNEMNKLDEVWTVLQANPDVFGRWIMQGENVYRDDAELLAVLGFVGCTPEEVATVTAPA